MAFKKAKSFSLISFLTRLLIFVLILLTVGYFVGNYLIVKFFGEDGSVLPLGATGWGDIVTVASALKSSEPAMAEEDRASTFEYMMADDMIDCLNKNMPVWKKATSLSFAIDAVFKTVTADSTEYWERYL